MKIKLGGTNQPHWQHQIEYREHFKEEFFGVECDQGLGKTRMIIDNIAALYQMKRIIGALILAPKAMYDVWLNKADPEECHYTQYMPKGIQENAFAIRWDAAKGNTLPYKQQRNDMLAHDGAGLRYFVVNLEALSNKRGTAEVEAFLKYVSPVLMVIDQSTLIGERTSKRTKTALRLGKMAAYRRILTGQYALNSPGKVFTQMAFLSTSILGSSYFSFRGEYAIMKPITNHGGRTIQVIDKWRNLTKLKEKIDPYTFRRRADDCLDLPQSSYAKITVDFDPKQEQIYNQIVEYSIAELESMDTVPAPIMLTKILMLRQILCGHVRTEDGEFSEVPTRRYATIIEYLQTTDDQVVIWCPFRHTLDTLAFYMQEKFGPDSTVTHTGGDSARSKTEARQRFKNKQAQYIIATPGTGKFGLNELKQARTTIYVDNQPDLEMRVETEARTRRGGSKGPNRLYVDFVTPGSVQVKIIEALREKREISTHLTGESFKEWIRA